MAVFISESDMSEFMGSFEEVLNIIVTKKEFAGCADYKDYADRLLRYNVPHGKRHRGQAFLIAYKCMKGILSKEDKHLSFIIAWCIELLGSYFLVIDDVMDAATIRRAQKCWHCVDDVQLAAIFDAVFMRSCINCILRKYFKTAPYYARLLEIFQDVDLRTTIGQSLDTRIPLKRRYDMYTPETLDLITKYKTSYFCYYLPVAVAMAMTSRNDVNEIRHCQDVVLRIAKFLQYSNDYFEVYQDYTITKKIGTDIEEGKCAWVVVTALQWASAEEREKICENYGKRESLCVQNCKDLFDKLEIPKIYMLHERKTFTEVHALIDKLPSSSPKAVFRIMLESIHHLGDYRDMLEAGRRRDEEETNA